MRFYFFLFQRKLYILFSISFLIFWNSINLAYVSQLRDEDLISDYIFTSQRRPHSLPGMVFLLTLNYHSGQPRPLSAGRRVEPATKFSKRRCLIGPQLLEGVAGKEEGTFFKWGLQFSHKKLKSGVFNDKKVYKQKYFSLS